MGRADIGDTRLNTPIPSPCRLILPTLPPLIAKSSTRTKRALSSPARDDSLERVLIFPATARGKAAGFVIVTGRGDGYRC